MISPYVVPGLKNYKPIWGIRSIRHIRSIDDICTVCCPFFNISQHKLLEANRKSKVVIARQAISFIAHEICGHTLKEIGDYFRQDHTTIVHSRNTIQNRMDTEPDFKNDIYSLIEMIKRV